jgi:GT2 family glycosyltransferase
VQVLAVGSNAGVAAGNNAGIVAARDAGATAVLLLNNDAEMATDVLERLYAELERAGPSAWAAAPKILYLTRPEHIWSAGGRFDWWRGLSRDRGTDEPDRGQYDRTEDIEYANTCCLLVRIAAFEQVGLMDEAYYMYYDDSDFSARMRRAGGRIRYVPDARVLHAVQASSGRVDARPTAFALYYTTRNRARFIARNAPTLIHRLAAHTFTIGSRFVRAGSAWLGGRRPEAGLVLRALADGYVRRQTGPADRPIPRFR